VHKVSNPWVYYVIIDFYGYCLYKKDVFNITFHLSEIQIMKMKAYNKNNISSQMFTSRGLHYG